MPTSSIRPTTYAVWSKRLEESGADNVGGVLQTVPADDTPAARAIAIGLSHPFGVGNSYFRTGARERARGGYGAVRLLSPRDLRPGRPVR